MDAMIPNKMFVCFFFKLPFLRVFHGISGCPDICHLVIHRTQNWTHWQDMDDMDSHRVPQCLPLLMHFDAILHDLESHHVALFHSRQTNAPTFAVLNRGPSWSDNKIRSRGTHLIVWLIWKSYCCYCFKIRGCLVSRDINVQCNK